MYFNALERISSQDRKKALQEGRSIDDRFTDHRKMNIWRLCFKMTIFKQVTTSVTRDRCYNVEIFSPKISAKKLAILT
jgi:hypothetical protein